MRRPACNSAEIVECFRNPSSNACRRGRACLLGWLEVRWLCRILPQIVPPIPLPQPDPPPWGEDPLPWPAGLGAGLTHTAFDADLDLDLLAPSRFHRDETVLPSAVAFIRKEGLVPEAARNLAARLRETADLLEKEAELMKKHAG